MKRIFAIILSGALLLCAAGCTGAPAASEPAVPAENGVAVQPAQGAEGPVQLLPEGQPAPDPVLSAQPAAETPSGTSGESADTDRALEAMHPVLDSIMRSVGYRCEDGWHPEDATTLWTALYLLGMNFEWNDARITHGDSFATVPKALMEEWAPAFGEAVTSLPEMPEAIDFMRYDAAQDAYLLNNSDVGDSETRIDSYADNGDGTYALRLGLYMGDGERLGGLDFVLVPNALVRTDAPADQPAYAFTVRSVAAEPPAVG